MWEFARHRNFPSWAALIGLWIGVIIIWCILFGRLSPAAWQLPTSYRSDALNELAIMRAASQGHYLPLMPKLVPNLGAPDGANWNDMPSTEDFHYAVFGFLASIIGLMPAANLAVLLAVLLSATGFFCTCRLLHYRLVWSVAGAALYAFSHYAWHRGLDHLELTYIGHLPLALLATWWLAAGVVRTFSDWRAGFILAVGLFSGLQNVYYTNVILQLAVFALLANLVRARSDARARKTAVICVAFSAAVAAGFIIGNIDTFCFDFIHGKNPAVLVRGYAGTELYALKPLEMFLPGVSHRVSALRGLTKEYLQVTVLRGEIRSGYLGFAGIVGLLWLICFAFWRAATGVRVRRWPTGIADVIWIMTFSVVGGVNCFIALCGFPLFRATNRYSIFILAIALLFLVRICSIVTRRWPQPLQIGLATVLVGAGLFDQTYPGSPTDGAQQLPARVSSDRNFIAALERQLPAHAAVFQLPFMPYPEAAAIVTMSDYEHFRPFLYAQTLRFSYGNNKGRGREDWQQQIERLDPAAAAERLRAKGFAAVIIDRDGFTDHGSSLLEAYERSGCHVIAEAAQGDFIALDLPQTGATNGE